MMSRSDHNESSSTPPSGITDVELLEVRLDDELAALESRLEAAFDDLERRCTELDRREADIQQRSHLIAIRESKTRLQRRRIAEELRAQRAELQLHSKNTVAAGENDAKLDELRHSQEDMLRELKLQRDLADEALNDAAVLREKLADSDQAIRQVQQLQDQLAATQSELESLREESPGPDLESQGCIERLEAELADAQCEIERLRAAEQSPITADATEDGGEDGESDFDWEAQKRLLMEHMDDDGAGISPQLERVERCRTVLETGVAADPGEIELLRQQLTELMGALASACNEGGEPFDFAGALEVERSKLQAIQEEWHEKLRQSELEISIERAKLARQRVKLEEEMRALQEQQSALADVSQPRDSAESTTSKGRWMARLGLTDSKD